MRVGADVDQLRQAVLDARGPRFALEHALRVARWAVGPYLWRSARPGAAPGGVVDAARAWADGIAALDRWALAVAEDLRRTDTDGADRLWHQLLALGPAHPVVRDALARGHPPTALGTTVLRSMSAEQLEALAAVAALPLELRDAVHRERARRWLEELDARLSLAELQHASDPDRPGTLTRWLDRHLLDRTDVVVDLYTSVDDDRERLLAEAAGMRRLLADPALQLLDFDPAAAAPARGPTTRVALGDLDGATDVAWLLPGTGSGVVAPGTALADAHALHDQLAAVAPDVTVVLDLYGAPPDLGRAADPTFGDAAAAAAVAAIAALVAPRTRVTPVGHSYGAYTAGRTVVAASEAGIPLAGLVLLGAPGAGVRHASELRLPAGAHVWAARAPGDPIALVADLDEHVRAVAPDGDGPLHAPLAALGPDPLDPEFGARVLPLSPIAGDQPELAGSLAQGHLDYLRPGSAALANVARVVLGDEPA